MPIPRPEDGHPTFGRLFSAGDLDGVVALYEQDAVLLPQPGAVARGHAAIREALAGFMALKGRFSMAPTTIIPGPGLAVLIADWTLDATGPDGKPMRLEGRTCDVLRRQADGGWLFAIDSPFGAAGVG
ncbi:MAG: SgcJ/EcaC family oxidoreductase [Burkholderiales bacterium]